MYGNVSLKVRAGISEMTIEKTQMTTNPYSEYDKNGCIHFIQMIEGIDPYTEIDALD